MALSPIWPAIPVGDISPRLMDEIYAYYGIDSVLQTLSPAWRNGGIAVNFALIGKFQNGTGLKRPMLVAVGRLNSPCGQLQPAGR